jgi:hypothetical protein
MRVVAAALALAFVVFALLQLNDPDPVGWTAIYGAAALAWGLAAAGRPPWPLAAAVGMVAAAWAATLAPGVIASGKLRDLAGTMGPGSGAEEARELLGLVIVAVAMAALVLARDKLKRSRRLR